MSPQPPTSQEEQLPRDLAGVYRLTHSIGHGGMGVVYGGEHLALQRKVAVKMMRMAFAENADVRDQALKRFLREARALASVDSTHVVHVHDFGRTEADEYYLVMDYIEGASLHEMLRRFGKFPPELALDLGMQIARAIEAAHKTGIIHRDLKPSNVMVADKEGNPFYAIVLDFGLAKSLTGDETVLTQTGHAIGTADTMAPEQIKEGDVVDHRCDIYSTGVILYNLTTGKRLFDAANFTAMCFNHVYEKPVPPIQRIENAGITPAFNDVIMKCLEKDPKDRFQSMQALHDALKALPDRRDIAPDIVAKMPLLEKTEDRPATKSDAGHASSQGAALQEEFFEAATLDHGTSSAFNEPGSVDLQVRNNSGSWPLDSAPTKPRQQEPTVPDGASWTEAGVHQTALTQENVAMTTVAPEPPKRAWFLPAVVVILLIGVGGLLFVQNQQFQNLAAQQSPKEAQTSAPKPTETPPATPTASDEPAKAVPSPKPKKAATKQPKATRKRKRKAKTAAPVPASPPKPEPKVEEKPTPVTEPKPAKKENPFMRQFTDDKKKENKKNGFIRLNTN